MATTFQRLCGPERSLSHRQFTVETDSRRPALCCPACGHVFDLPLGIDYDIGGTTNLEVPCLAPRCGWKDRAVFESIWEEP